jgi:small GTP-binding protein
MWLLFLNDRKSGFIPVTIGVTFSVAMRTVQSHLIRAEKVVLVGSHSCGKTSLVTRFVHNAFSPRVVMTVGAAYTSKVMSVGHEKIQLDIWDTAGSERYRALTPLYYRDARAAIVCFDVTRPETVDEAARWTVELREKALGLVLIYGVANKCDLHDARRVTPSHVNEFGFANQFNLVYETSALSGQGVNDLFQQIAKDFLTLPQLPADDSETALQGDTEPGRAGGGCPC